MLAAAVGQHLALRLLDAREMLCGFLAAAEPLQRAGQRVSRLAVGGRQIGRAPEGVHRVGVAARMQMDLSDAGMGRSVEGIDEQRRHELGQRLVGAVLLHQRAGQEPVHRRVVRVGAYGARECVDGSRTVSGAQGESPDGRVKLAFAEDGGRCDLLDFLPRFGRPMDLLIRQRQPPVREHGIGQHANSLVERAFGVRITARRVQHARERQPRAFVTRREADGGRQRRDALVVVRFRPVDEAEHTMRLG